jgi:radical SAM/Cys-rich protein
VSGLSPEPSQASPLPAGRPHPQPELGEAPRLASLAARRLPLADPRQQVATLDALDLRAVPHGGHFEAALAAAGWPALRPARLEIFQVNLGKLCNMTCRHCHVDAGPDRSDAVMDRATAEACLAAFDRSGAHTLDLTGGAPELNPSFRWLVDEAAARGAHVIDRCNLTVLLTTGARDLPVFLAERGVEVVCSLPHVRRRNTDAQRGEGTYEKSLRALRLLNEQGYGQGDPRRVLTLVTNPTGAYLPGSQGSLEREWKEALAREHGLAFDRLIALANLPIARFLEWLEASGNLQAYMELLVNAFNPATIGGLMCRTTISVAWDGRVYDCDFNQMLELGVAGADGGTLHIRDFEPERWAARRILTGRHCFGCTAGAGSSCGGSLVEPK